MRGLVFRFFLSGSPPFLFIFFFSCSRVCVCVSHEHASSSPACLSVDHTKLVSLYMYIQRRKTRAMALKKEYNTQHQYIYVLYQHRHKCAYETCNVNTPLLIRRHSPYSVYISSRTKPNTRQEIRHDKMNNDDAYAGKDTLKYARTHWTPRLIMDAGVMTGSIGNQELRFGDSIPKHTQLTELMDNMKELKWITVENCCKQSYRRDNRNS